MLEPGCEDQGISVSKNGKELVHNVQNHMLAREQSVILRTQIKYNLTLQLQEKELYCNWCVRKAGYKLPEARLWSHLRVPLFHR